MDSNSVLYYVQQLLGEAPAGYEIIEYIFAGCLLVLLCFSAVSLISSVFKWIGGM